MRRRKKMEWDGERIHALRHHLGMTQHELAEELGTRQQTISQWETGMYKPKGASSTLLTIVAERAKFDYEPKLGVKVGCCGFPKGMRHYFSKFKLVEVQQTFYKPPQLKTLRRWREEAPPDFEFSLKAWQLITHPSSSPTYRRAGLEVPPEKREEYGSFKPTEEVIEAWHKTKEIAQTLKARFIVFQCPPSFVESQENIENMRSFFTTQRDRECLFAWEPRGGWREETIKTLCRELDLIHCVDPYERGPLCGKVQYFRLHGGPGYRHSYSDEELVRVKEMIRGETYLLFNNITMYEDSLRLMRLIGR